MKFLHLGDLHLGRTIGEFDLTEDQEYILNQIVELAKEKQADAILIAGDVYDKSVPSEKAVNLFDSFLKKLASEKLATYIVSGNHDSDIRLDFGKKLFETNDIFIKGTYQGEIGKQIFQDEYGPVNIYMLPFIKASHVRHYFPDEEINSYDDAVKVALKHTQIDKNERNILIAHQFVAGNGQLPELGGSENLAVQQVGNVEQIYTNNFDNFHYVALGHIHRPQEIGRREIRYAGSPLKYSQSEIGYDKSVPFITMDENGNVEIELCNLTPLHDVIPLKGELNTLLKPENIVTSDAYVYVTLTDENPIPNAMGIFQQYYPRTIKITYENSHSKALGEGKIEEIMAEEVAFPDLISSFYSMMYGCDISEEEMKIMKEVAREAGVFDEAD